MREAFFFAIKSNMTDQNKQLSAAPQKSRVIVTYGRSLISLMIAQSLGSRGIEIIGSDSLDMTVLSFSSFVKKNEIYSDPSEDENAFLDDLEHIIDKYKPGDERPYVLIPGFTEARIIARHADRFKDKITLAVPDFSAINAIDPKDHFAKTCEKYNIHAPKTHIIEDDKRLQSLPGDEDLDYPALVKPPAEVGGRGIKKLDDETALRTYLDQAKQEYGLPLLVQETVKGEDYCYCAVYDNGRRIASMAYTNIQKFPAETGAGVVRETVEHEQFDKIADPLMKELKWSGIAEIDFMWDGDKNSDPYMIEVNTRFWMALDHSVKSGVDFPYLLYCQALGRPAENDTPKTPEIGKRTGLPGLPLMAAIEQFFKSTVHFDHLEQNWPDIKDDLKDLKIKDAFDLFKDSLQDSVTIKEAFEHFGVMINEAKAAEKIFYAKDDPFIGFGALFILASLIRHGRLPPEIKM